LRESDAGFRCRPYGGLCRDVCRTNWQQPEISGDLHQQIALTAVRSPASAASWRFKGTGGGELGGSDQCSLADPVQQVCLPRFKRDQPAEDV
jgi:hypothetical protein